MSYTTPSSEDVCTTGSITQVSSGRLRSSARALRTCASLWHARSLRRWSVSELSRSPSVLVWQRRSTGRTPLSFLGADKLESETALETLGAVVKDHEDQQVVAAHLQEVLGDDNVVTTRGLGRSVTRWVRARATRPRASRRHESHSDVLPRSRRSGSPGPQHSLLGRPIEPHRASRPRDRLRPGVRGLLQVPVTRAPVEHVLRGPPTRVRRKSSFRPIPQPWTTTRTARCGG